MLPQVSGALNPTTADGVQINWRHSLHYEFTPGVRRGLMSQRHHQGLQSPRWPEEEVCVCVCVCVRRGNTQSSTEISLSFGC